MSKKEKLAEVPTFSEALEAMGKKSYDEMFLSEGGLLKLKDEKGFYEQNIKPEDVPMAHITKTQTAETLAVAGTLLGAGRRAAEAFQANPDLQQVTIDINFGKNRVDHVIKRDGETISGYTVSGLRGSGGGNYKKVQDHLSGLIKNQLS